MIPTLLADPVMVRSEGSWLEDVDGRRYLDCVAGPGVLALGHCHPSVTRALAIQAGTLVHSSFQVNEPVLRLAEQLTELLGEPFSRVFLTNSGSEAVEAAVKLAKKYQARAGRPGHGLLALENGYHGRSGISLALTGMSLYKRGLPGFSLYPGVVHVPVPSDDAGLARLHRHVDAAAQDEIVAVVVEPVLGVGGVIEPPPGFFRWIAELCRDRGALLIVDEIFTGLGRTGRLFAYTDPGLVPDIVVLGKALGAGLPIGAVVTREEIADAFDPIDHSTTFGGNVALAGAAGCAVLDELVAARLPDAAARLGARLREALTTAADGLPAQVRGKGLLIGLEFAPPDRVPLAEGPSPALRYQQDLLTRGVLVGIGGPRRSVVRFTPPLTLSDSEFDLLAHTAAAALKELQW